MFFLGEEGRLTLSYRARLPCGGRDAHFSREMMQHKDSVGEECAYEGKVVEL